MAIVISEADSRVTRYVVPRGIDAILKLLDRQARRHFIHLYDAEFGVIERIHRTLENSLYSGSYTEDEPVCGASISVLL